MFGQGFYELRNANLMEREMIHHLSGHLTISGLDGQTIAPEPALAKKPTPMPILIPSAAVTVDSHLPTSNNPPPSYTTYPEDDLVVSSYSDSCSNSSRESSPPSPSPKAPPRRFECAVNTGRQDSPHTLYRWPFRYQNEAWCDVHRWWARGHLQFGSWCQLVIFKITDTFTAVFT